jgi:hypothetical protein
LQLILFNHMKNIIAKGSVLAVISLLAVVFWSGAEASSLTLSPSSGTYNTVEVITVNILLNTAGAPIDGVDVYHLNYDPALLQVIDEDPSIAGTQIQPGSLMATVPANANIVDTSLGRIKFSQVTVNPPNGGIKFSNPAPQTLATVRFNVLAAGTAELGFDALTGSTLDTNVAQGDIDTLTSATGATFTLTSSPGDDQAPNIFNLGHSNVTETSATIAWQTDEPATSRVGYGLTSCMDNMTPFNASLVTSHSQILSGLSAGTPYFYCAFSEDSLGNQAISTQQSFSTQSPPAPDTTPPAAITDLRVTATTRWSATIEWTAPGDDDNSGTATGYDIRYMKNTPITEANWASAVQLTGEPAPGPAGTVQTYVAADRRNIDSKKGSVYIAIKTRDEVPNWSAVSNNTVKLAENTSSSLIASAISPLLAQADEGENDITPPPTVSSFKAQGANQQVLLTWTNPASADYVRTVIVRNSMNQPMSATDGMVVYEGVGNAYVDTNVDNNVAYYYAAFTFDHSSNYSAGVHAKAVAVPNKTSYSVKESDNQDVQVTKTITTAGMTITFSRDLTMGNSGEDVRQLQKFLNSQGFKVSDAGPGSPGQESDYFGVLTKAALMLFQDAHAAEILRPLGLTKGTGYFGQSTRAKLNGLVNRTVPTLPAQANPTASSQMIELQTQINALLEQVAELQAQLSEQVEN